MTTHMVGHDEHLTGVAEPTMKTPLMRRIRKRIRREEQRIRRARRRDLLLRRMPQGGVCAEIGVWKGAFSSRILKKTNPAEIHLIDPWALQPDFPDCHYGGKKGRRQQDINEIYNSVCRRFTKDPRVVIHRGFSLEVVEQFPDAFFDWIYVDGNHYFEHALNDLSSYYPKVRPGGYIAGDDYLWGPRLGYPVKRAVHAFLCRHDVEVIHVEHDQFVLQRTIASRLDGNEVPGA